MKKKDFVEGLIEKTEFPNKGTFAFEDREITVKGVIQGQRIAGQVTKLRKGKAVARWYPKVSSFRDLRGLFLSDGFL